MKTRSAIFSCMVASLGMFAVANPAHAQDKLIKIGGLFPCRPGRLFWRPGQTGNYWRSSSSIRPASMATSSRSNSRTRHAARCRRRRPPTPARQYSRLWLLSRSSDATLAIMPVMEQAKVPLLNAGSSSIKITSFGMMRNVHGLPGSVILIEDEPALSSGTFACSITGMIARVTSEHSSPTTTSGLYCSSRRLAACVAGSGLHAESSNLTSSL